MKGWGLTIQFQSKFFSAAYSKAQCEYAESILFDCSINTVNRCYSVAKIDEKAAQTKGALRER